MPGSQAAQLVHSTHTATCPCRDAIRVSAVRRFAHEGHREEFGSDKRIARAEAATPVAGNAVAVVTLFHAIQRAITAGIHARAGDAEVARALVIARTAQTDDILAEGTAALLGVRARGVERPETVAGAFGAGCCITDLATIKGAVAAEVGARPIAAFVALALVSRRARHAGVADAECTGAFGIARAELVLIQITACRAAFSAIACFAGIHASVAARGGAGAVHARRPFGALQVIDTRRARSAHGAHPVGRVHASLPLLVTDIRGAFPASIARALRKRINRIPALDAEGTIGLGTTRAPEDITAVLVPSPGLAFPICAAALPGLEALDADFIIVRDTRGALAEGDFAVFAAPVVTLLHGV